MQGYSNSKWGCCMQMFSVASVNTGNKVLHNDINGLFDVTPPPLSC